MHQLLLLLRAQRQKRFFITFSFSINKIRPDSVYLLHAKTNNSCIQEMRITGLDEVNRWIITDLFHKLNVPARQLYLWFTLEDWEKIKACVTNGDSPLKIKLQ